jgi:hypothetical protein
MRTSKQQKEPPSPKTTRKPPRLTPAIIRYAGRFGFDVRISQRPDGTTVTELTRPESDQVLQR